jgi:hypothetical protein
MPGAEITLEWRGAPASELTLLPVGPLPGTSGQLILSPTETTTYTLIAENFWSKLIGWRDIQSLGRALIQL